MNDKKIWKQGNKPLLARWTSDFDCQEETNWWYVIKDSPFRKMLSKFGGINIVHKLNGILKMEEIVRNDEK